MPVTQPLPSRCVRHSLTACTFVPYCDPCLWAAEFSIWVLSSPVPTQCGAASVCDKEVLIGTCEPSAT
jgi:hypothetical protein